MSNNISLHLLNSVDYTNNIKLINSNNSSENMTNEPFYIKELKIQIINKLLIPISNDDLDTVVENDFLISFYKDKIQQFLSLFPNKFQLQTFKYILDVVNYAIIYHRIILASRRNELKDKEFGKIQKHLGIVQFKVEYVLYDEILGKPDRKNREKYKPEIINDIRLQLNLVDITFQKIKIFITQKYKC